MSTDTHFVRIADRLFDFRVEAAHLLGRFPVVVTTRQRLRRSWGDAIEMGIESGHQCTTETCRHHARKGAPEPESPRHLHVVEEGR